MLTQPPPIVPKGTMINLDITDDGNAIYRVLNCFGNEALVSRMSMFGDNKIRPSITKYCEDATHIININGIDTLNYDGSSLDIELENYYNLLTSEAKAAIVPMPVIQDVWGQASSTNYDIELNGYYKKIGENHVGNRHISPLSFSQLIEYFNSTQNISHTDFCMVIANLTAKYMFPTNYGYRNITPGTWISTTNQNCIFCSYSSSGAGHPAPISDRELQTTIVFTIDLSKINYTINTTPIGGEMCYNNLLLIFNKNYYIIYI